MSHLSSDEQYALCKLGYQLYTHGKLDDARRIFDGLVALDEDNGYAWHVLGLIARQRQQIQRAFDCFQQRLDLEPGAATSRVELAETLYRQDYVAQAIDVLRPLGNAPEDDSEAARRGRVLLRKWRG
mgnify:CR=1 FL=1